MFQMRQRGHENARAAISGGRVWNETKQQTIRNQSAKHLQWNSP
jgi:hypothetical protein